MKLSRETWLQVEPLLTTGLEMEAVSRAEWLRGVEASHPQLAPIVRRMLATHERAERGRSLETGPRLAVVPSASTYVAGQALGPFRLVAPLGRGGMGEVWLARQAEGGVDRNVALKLPALHQQGDTWRERFRRERDILARLEHPHIARLYDAGVTESGQPWLAMEYVEGRTLSEHVAARADSMPERLALFRQVLSAVIHAHRHLVVHRDLKPPNILVDGAGQVKLLDFGIAKLLGGEDEVATSGELTRIGGRVMTLRYAAPEQVAAGDITTSTDIYSLGVILHELVTGLAPYRAVREGRALTDVSLLQEQTTIPSRLPIPRQLSRLVSGDLDAIVLKAMRRDPADRYASVERFDEDVRAHLEKRPVKARAGTWRYLAGRFAARHKLPLAAAATALVTLVAGLVMADHERRVAVAEKARAERHLASVRKLANTFIFDVHAKLENLPGSLDARETIIKTSLEYLDALAGEAGRDPALTFSIATAYRDIGNIQGRPGRASRGDLVAAIGNLEKSKRLFVELERGNRGDIGIRREHRRLSESLTRAYAALPDPRWEGEAAETLRLSESLAAAPGANAADRSLLPLARMETAYLAGRLSGDGRAAGAAMTGPLGELEALTRGAPEDLELRERLAAAYHRTGTLLGYAGRTPQSVREAIAYMQKARTLIASVRAEAPNDASKQALAAAILYDVAMTQRVVGELRQADQAMLEGLALSERLVAADPANAELAMDRLRSLAGASHLAIQLEDLPRAMRHAREAFEIAARLPEPARKSHRVRVNVANAQAGLGYALLASAGPAAGDRKARLALLLEARENLAHAAAYLAVMRAEKNLGMFPDDEVRNFEDKVKRCDAEIARLQAS